MTDRAPSHDKLLTYICPMHSEVPSDAGSCPIRGMGLELESASMDAGPNPELVDFTRRFRVGLVLTIPLLILTMGPFFGLPVRDIFGERSTLSEHHHEHR